MSPITLYLFRNLGKNPLITGVVLVSMIAIGMAIGGVGAVLTGLSKAFAVVGDANRVLVTSHDAVAESSSALKIDALAIAKANPEVIRVSPEIVVVSLTPHDHGSAVEPVELRGLDPVGMSMHGYSLIEGRAPAEGANEVILGENLARHLTWAHLGSKVSFLNEQFDVVGIFRAPSYVAGEAWTTRATFISDPRRATLSVIYIDTASAADAASLIKRLRSTRQINVDAVSEPEFYKRMRGQHANLVKALMIIFALVMTGAIVVASSLLSLIQRRRIGEYFTLRALGFRSFAIARFVIYETELLALSGGVVGLVCALVAMRSFNINSTSNRGFTINFTSQISAQLVVVSLGILVVVGLLGAIAPVIRVTRADLPSGLRED